MHTSAAVGDDATSAAAFCAALAATSMPLSMPITSLSARKSVASNNLSVTVLTAVKLSWSRRVRAGESRGGE
jgi:hypothetical protein